MEIGILGGTGNAGRALAGRLVKAGYVTTIGSRTAKKAEAAVEKLHTLWKPRIENFSVRACENSQVADADIIIVATPPKAAAATTKELSKKLSKKIVISMCNDLKRNENNSFAPKIGKVSIAEAIQDSAPKALVASAFHHLPAKQLSNLETPIKNDVLICSDFKEALAITSSIVQSIKDLRPLNAGPLLNSISLEAFTSTLLNLSSTYQMGASLKITGREND